jgi:hypothetical protein
MGDIDVKKSKDKMNTVIAPGFDLRVTVKIAMEFNAMIVIDHPGMPTRPISFLNLEMRDVIFDTYIDALTYPKKVSRQNAVLEDKPWSKESRYKRKF